jgi:GMP synthase-like glutamine amidotransferase
MEVLGILHSPYGTPGLYTDVVAALGHTLTPWNITDRPLDENVLGFDAVIAFGGAMHPDQEEEYPWLEYERFLFSQLIADQTPFLGLCLGAQLLAKEFGGSVARTRPPEIGWYEVELCAAAASDPVLRGLPERILTYQSHRYVFTLPPEAVLLAENACCAQAYRLGERAWGLQFHPEVTPERIAVWCGLYHNEPMAAEMHLDIDALLRRSAEEIATWMEVGATICRNFLDFAAS